MTRKHFEALAEVIRCLRYDPKVDEQSRIVFAKEIAHMCKRFNPGFKPIRFLEACGIGSDK